MTIASSTSKPEREDQRKERDAVDRLMREHSDAERDEERERDRRRDDERLAPSEHEQEQRDDPDRFDQPFDQLVDREVGLLAVVARHAHGHARRKLGGARAA